MGTPLTPQTLNIFMGKAEIAQKRRAAYEKAAKKSARLLGGWIRQTLDKASGFDESKFSDNER